MSSAESFRFVLLRHGQSQWNLENRFTGWTDIELTRQGRLEAQHAARLIKSSGYTFDIAFASVLRRAVETLEIVSRELSLRTIPIQYAWQLNERHYGALQGLNKTETAQRLGTGLVMSWRRSYADRPPALDLNDPRHPRFDPHYANLPSELLPRSESLQDTEQRVSLYWEKSIKPLVQAGLNILIVAHGNSLRALVRYLEQIPPEQVPELDIPTAVPIVFETDSKLKPIRRYSLTKT